jgi:hypothetical protein
MPRNEAEVQGERIDSRKGDSQAGSTADAVARRSYGKLVAFVATRTRDVAAAEDALSTFVRRCKRGGIWLSTFQTYAAVCRNHGIAFSAGLYEQRVSFRWFSRSSESGICVNSAAMRSTDTGRRFWKFVTTVRLTPLRWRI